MSDPVSPVEIIPADVPAEAHRQGILNALARRIIEQIYFRNTLAMLMIVTLCWKEASGLKVSETFYMLVGLVIGLYFKSPNKGETTD